MQRIYRGYPQMMHTTEAMEQTGWECGQTNYIGPADWMFQVPMEDGWQEQPEEAWVQKQTEPALEPYMVYRGSEQEIPMIDRYQALRMEMDYFKSLYPQSVRKYQTLVDEVCDHLDYDGSPMYDEYPDRVSLFRTRDQVCRRAREAGIDDNRDLAQILLVNEMNRRRFLRKN